MIYSIEELRKRVFPVAEKYGIRSIDLIGSYARGTATEESDIDLIIDTEGTNLTSLFRLGAVYCDLEDAIGKKIDLITANSLKEPIQRKSEIRFRENIQREKVSLYVVE
ncbi:MAG: nucleotidyltransferase family protein [Bacillota bacterium]|jgi:predicted nucleotidyltransferase